MKKISLFLLASAMCIGAACTTAMAEDPSSESILIFEENFDSANVGDRSTDWFETYNVSTRVEVKAKDNDADDHYAEVASVDPVTGQTYYQARLRSDDGKKIAFESGKKYRLSFDVKGISNVDNTKCMVGIMGTSGYAVVNDDNVKFSESEWRSFSIEFDGQDVTNYIYFSAQSFNGAHSFAIDNIKLEEVASAKMIQGTKNVYTGTMGDLAAGFFAEIKAYGMAVEKVGVKLNNVDMGTRNIPTIDQGTVTYGVVVSLNNENDNITLYVD